MTAISFMANTSSNQVVALPRGWLPDPGLDDSLPGVLGGRSASRSPLGPQGREDAIAHLTETAYRAVLEHGYHGSFLELELSLWNAIRRAVEHDVDAVVPRGKRGVES